jgi:hypothetical protein
VQNVSAALVGRPVMMESVFSSVYMDHQTRYWSSREKFGVSLLSLRRLIPRAMADLMETPQALHALPIGLEAPFRGDETEDLPINVTH